MCLPLGLKAACRIHCKRLRLVALEALQFLAFGRERHLQHPKNNTKGQYKQGRTDEKTTEK
jgi:hypothetical protein